MTVDLLRELFDWIANQLVLNRAVEWHCGSLPPETSVPAAVLLERGGIPSLPVLRGNVGERLFQVLTIGTTYFTTRALAVRIHDLLKDLPGVALGDNHAHVIEAVNELQQLAGDERFRFQLSADYAVRDTAPATWWAH